MKKLLIFLMMILGISLNAQQWKWYLTSSAGQPWGSVSNITAMNTAFGAAWSQGTFQGTPVNAVFHPSVCLVYLDGGSTNATAMENYILANSVIIQNWVFNGGRLFFNAAPNQGLNQNWFFGGVTLNYNVGPYSGTGYAATAPAHPIFVGPAPVSTTVHTGNYFCHGYITGPGITTIISNTVSAWTGTQPPMPKTILASKPWGAGMCLFGSMTNTSFHTPNPSATNLRANMLSWLYVCCLSPTISVAATQSVICSGQTTTLTASGVGGGGTYTWNPGNITSPTIAVTPTATTIYTAAGTNSAGCVGSLTFQIIVNPTPTVTPIATPTIVCKNSPITLSVNAPAGTPTYTWTGPSGWVSNFQNPLISQAQPSNTGIYTINVVSTFTNGTCFNSNTVAVNVINTNTITSNNPTVCLNSGINLTSTVTGSSNLLWQGPNSFTSNLQNPQITPATQSNAGIYTVTAFFTVPGQTLICQSQSQSTVSVIITSMVSLTVPVNVCQNTNPVISASATGTPSWSWQGPNFSSSLTTNTLVNIQPSSSGIYSVTANWSLGSVTCSIGNSSNLNVVGVSQVSVSSPIQVCYPSNITLTSSATGAVSYSWASSGGLFYNGQQNLIFTNPTSTVNGTWTVTAGFTNGQLNCFNTATTSVQVNPILTFSLEPWKLMCPNSTYSVSGPVGATSYTWSGPGGFSSNLQNLWIPQVQPTSSGFYTLQVNLGPCVTSSTTQVEVLSTIGFTSTSGIKKICKGDSTTLSVGVSGGSGNYAFNWNPNLWLSNTTSSVQNLNPGGSTYYNVAVWDISCPNNKISIGLGVEVLSAPVPSLEIPTSGCEPLCFTLDTKLGNSISGITWNLGKDNYSGDVTRVCLDPGTYSLNMIVDGKNGCRSYYKWEKNPIQVYHKPGGDFTFTPDKPNHISDNKVAFSPTHRWGKLPVFIWNFSGGKSVDGASDKYPIREYEEVGKYPVALITQNEWGCSDTVLNVIDVEEDYSIFIPNAFTPNKTGLNETFHPVVYGALEYRLSIFDRWGECLISDMKNGQWDGTYRGILCKNEVYIWKIVVTKLKSNEKKEYVGHVTLLK